jgi:hypothetical protein
MNFAGVLIHQINMNLLKNVASITSSYAKENQKIIQMKLDSQRANAEYKYLKKASEK